MIKEQADALKAAAEYCSVVSSDLLRDAEQKDKELILQNAQAMLDKVNGKGYSNLVVFGSAFVAMETIFKEFGRSMEEHEDRQ